MWPSCNRCIEIRLVARKYLQPMQGPGVIPLAGGHGQHACMAEDGSTDGGPFHPIGYRLGRCWLLPWKYSLKKKLIVFTLPEVMNTYFFN